MNRILALCLFMTIAGQATAQNLKFVGRYNLGIGAQYETLDYNGASVLYSPGGGMGLEAGLAYEVVKNLDTYVTVGFQKNLALQYESMNGVSNKTSFSFGRTFVSGGINKLFQLSEGTFNGIILGGGINYNMPGKLKIIENNENRGIATYNSALGFHIDAKLKLKFNDNFSLEPGLRYRNINFESSNTLSGNSSFPEGLRQVNATGVDLSVSIAKRF